MKAIDNQDKRTKTMTVLQDVPVKSMLFQMLAEFYMYCSVTSALLHKNLYGSSLYLVQWAQRIAAVSIWNT